MSAFPPPMRACLQALQKLPGIGAKSAHRILFHLLDGGPEASSELVKSLEGLAASVETCPLCRSYRSVGESCSLCEDPRRDGRLLCVVESPADVFLIESTGEFRGSFHVLHGLLSPLKGVSPERLGLDVLQARLAKEGVEEVILATPPTAEGEATAAYLSTFLSGRVPTVSRIAYGLPVGADFQYVDSQTLSRALSGRKTY